MGRAPEYLQNLLVVCKPGRPGLRSALDMNLLVVPFARLRPLLNVLSGYKGPRCGTVCQRTLEVKQTLTFSKEN